MSIVSKILRGININKGTTEEKETDIKEGGAAWGGNEDFIEPEYERVTPRQIQLVCVTSNLLKKYIRVIVDECLRYKFTARPIESKKDDTRAQGRAATINALFGKCNSYETFDEVREKYIKDLYLYGRAGIEIQPTTNSDPKALYAVPGYCIKLNVDKTGANFKNPKQAYQIVDPNEPDKVVATFPEDSFVYFVADKLSDRVYGSQPINSIYSELTADIKSSKNIMAGTNTVKAGILCLPKTPRRLLADIVKRLTALVKKNARTKIVATNTSGEFLDISNLKPEDNVLLQKWLVKKANIFNIPPFKMGLADESGSLNAREQRDDFRAVIEGIVQYELDKLNAILVKSKYKFDDVEIVVPDFATKLSYERTRIAVRLVNAGIITPNEARIIYLGLEKSDDENADRLYAPTEITEESEKKEEKAN